jgi:uncharacterized protein (DUF58 family)
LNQPSHAETVDSVTVRPYAPGDAFRYVHWPTTARQDELFVRVFAPQAASRVWIIPDFDSSVHWYRGEHSSLELTITAAASLAAALLQKHLSVGLFAWDDKEVVLLPHQGQAHLWPILQALAPVRGSSKLSLRDVLSQARRLVSGTDVVIVLTPAINSDWLGELRDLAHSRSGRGRAEVILFDPGSLGPVDEATEKSQAASLPAAEQAIEPLLRLIREASIPAYSLRPEDVRIMDAYYGEVSRWEFVVMGTGKAVARKKPRSTGAFLLRP